MGNSYSLEMTSLTQKKDHESEFFLRTIYCVYYGCFFWVFLHETRSGEPHTQNRHIIKCKKKKNTKNEQENIIFALYSYIPMK